jgi:hypothetical protein
VGPRPGAQGEVKRRWRQWHLQGLVGRRAATARRHLRLQSLATSQTANGADVTLLEPAGVGGQDAMASQPPRGRPDGAGRKRAAAELADDGRSTAASQDLQVPDHPAPGAIAPCNALQRRTHIQLKPDSLVIHVARVPCFLIRCGSAPTSLREKLGSLARRIHAFKDGSFEPCARRRRHSSRSSQTSCSSWLWMLCGQWQPQCSPSSRVLRGSGCSPGRWLMRGVRLCHSISRWP